MNGQLGTEFEKLSLDQSTLEDAAFAKLNFSSLGFGRFPDLPPVCTENSDSDVLMMQSTDQTI
jgi:hypothetical protein